MTENNESVDAPQEESVKQETPLFSPAIMETLQLAETGDYEEFQGKREATLMEHLTALGKAAEETFNETADKVKDGAREAGQDPRVQKFTEGAKEATERSLKAVGEFRAASLSRLKSAFSKNSDTTSE